MATDRVVDLLRQLPEPAHLAAGLAALRVVMGSRSYMYIRPFAGLLASSVLVWRAFLAEESPESLFDYLSRILGGILGRWGRVHFLLKDLAGLALMLALLGTLDYFRSSNPFGLKRAVLNAVFPYIRKLSVVQKMLAKEKAKMESDMEKSLKVKSRELGEPLVTLPKKGRDRAQIIADMERWNKAEDQNWQHGRISGGVYHGEAGHIEFLNKVFGYYSIANPLHPDTWPSLMKCEAEIISMTASLVGGGVNGPVPTVCGCTTSGGTESIILAIKAHRDYYRTEYGITQPEMIACVSAHAAVDKGCEMLGVKLIKIPYEVNTYKMDLAATRAAVTSNTILIYSSAPCYPQGVIDNIPALGAIAKANNIGLHVDCCLGGFFLPFAKKLGRSIPDFEFTVPGVTSMSLDTHKYGYALKGTSVLLYRTPEIRQYQYFCYADWTGGLYTTPTIAGSRSGGVIAQTWASMVSLGEEGYLRCTEDILNTAARIREGVERIDGLFVIGQCEAMIVCIVGVGGINIYSVYDSMSHKGWSLNSHQNPACMHICCTVNHIGCEEQFLKDLAESVEEVKGGAHAGKSAGIYGMTASMPAGPVEDMLRVYNDVVLKM